MANIKLTPLLNELDFRTQAAFDKYNSTHKLRDSTKVTIAGKTTTAGQAEKKTKKKKPNSMFGTDYKKERDGKKDKKKDSTRRTSWEREAGAPYAEDDKFWVDRFLPGDVIAGDTTTETDFYMYRSVKIGISLNDWFKAKDKKDFNYDFKPSGNANIRITSEDGPVELVMFSPNEDGKFNFAFVSDDGDGGKEFTFGNPDSTSIVDDGVFGGRDGYDDPQYVYQSMRYIMAQPETIQLLRGELTMREYKPMYEKMKKQLEQSKSSKVNEITDEALLNKTIKYKDSAGREKEIKMKTALSKTYQMAKEPGMQNAYRTAKKMWDSMRKAGAKNTTATNNKPNSMFGGDYAKERGIKKESMKLTSLLPEAEDFQARSKETGKLVHFKSKDAYQAAIKAGSHEDPKAKKGDSSKAAAKPNDMFGGDYAKDRGGEAPQSDTTKVAPKADVKTIIKNLLKTADKEFKGVYKLKDIADDLNIDDTDGADGNMLQVRIDRGEDGTYIQTDETEGVIVFNDGSQYKLHHVEDGPIPVTRIDGNAPKSDASVDGQTDDELYDALYDMGYDFGELGSDDFDEEGFADAAMSLGYRYDDRNKVWNHRDSGKEAEPNGGFGWGPETDRNPASSLPKKASQLNSKHSKMVQDVVNAETGLKGYIDEDDNTGAFMYNAGMGDSPTYTLYFGSNDDYGKPNEFRVTLEPTYGNDPSGLEGKVDKSFKSPDEAMQYMVAVAKKYKKELEMDDEDTNESTKLTSMIKR
jgi:hypothetical protein